MNRLGSNFLAGTAFARDKHGRLRGRDTDDLIVKLAHCLRGADETFEAFEIARGFRLSIELVAGVLVGAAIGWLIDRALGLSPWGMIVFLLLGFAAGVLNVMRAAGVLPGSNLDPPGSK